MADDPSDEDERTQAGQALVVLRARVDEHFAGAMRRSPGAMKCRAGCDQCCHVRLSVFAIEADRISRALSDLARFDSTLRNRIRRQADDPDHGKSCPMLVDGACAIYEDRPLICRSHGLPVATTSPQGKTEIRGCPLNFTEAEPPPQSVLRLDAVNRPLVVMARMWDHQAERVELADLARALDG